MPYESYYSDSGRRPMPPAIYTRPARGPSGAVPARQANQIEFLASILSLQGVRDAKARAKTAADAIGKVAQKPAVNDPDALANMREAISQLATGDQNGFSGLNQAAVIGLLSGSTMGGGGNSMMNLLLILMLTSSNNSGIGGLF